MDTRDTTNVEAETDVSLAEELQSKLHDLEVCCLSYFDIQRKCLDWLKRNMYDNNDVDDGDDVDNDGGGDDDDDEGGDDDDDGGSNVDDDDGAGVGDDDDDDGGGEVDDDDDDDDDDDTYMLGSHRPLDITPFKKPCIPDITNAFSCFLPPCVGVPLYLY